jgi:DUF4097 and DUF4098 domain-containing protein YvlB
MALRAMAAAALVAFAACGGHREQAQSSIHRSWSAAELSKVKLQCVNGSVEVVASPSSTVVLDAEGHFEGSGASQVLQSGFLEMNVENGVLFIREKAFKNKTKVIPWFTAQHRFVEYRLQVPQQLALSVTNVTGEIEVNGVKSDTELLTVNGSIEVHSNGAPLVARSVNGSIEATFLEAFRGAKIRTVNGPVDVTVPANAEFVYNVSQVNGGFESNIPVELRKDSGEVHAVVGSASSSLEVNTVNGDVSVNREDNEEPEQPEQPEIAKPDTPVQPPKVPQAPEVSL